MTVTTVVLITLLGWNIRNKEDVNKQIWKSHVKRSIRSHPEHYSEFTGKSRLKFHRLIFTFDTVIRRHGMGGQER